ncbi:MAG: superoxide dismutase [Ni] [Phycisphaerales bacterium]|nr:superoxide dismutase [Ni] [Phycisphaerales bacterium]
MIRLISLVSACLFIAGMVLVSTIPSAQAHCQMPCGIYDDPARIAELKEDAQTIRKAVTSMQAMVQDDDTDPLLGFNQGARWVVTKDQHAQNIQDVVSYYFLTQRVKAVPADLSMPGHEHYVQQLMGFHRILVAAMKCKQTVDIANVDELDKAIEAVSAWY